MVRNKSRVAIGIIVILTSSFIVPALMIGEILPITGTLVLGLSSDNAAKATAGQLLRNIPEARLVRVNDEYELTRLVQKAIGEVFYVGHGSEQGLLIDESLLPWTQVSDLVKRSGSNEHYFAACYSANLNYDTNTKFIVGFQSIVDADVAAFVLISFWQYIHQKEISESLVQEFINSDGIDKIFFPQQPLYWITWTWSEGKNIGWTPYGLYNPNAVHIHYTAADVAFITANPTAMAFVIISFVVSIILAVFTLGAGIVWSVVTLLIAGFMIGMGNVANIDSNPDGSVDQYIPVDIINFAAGGGLNRWMRTTSWWWLMLLTYAMIPLYQVTPI